MDVVVVGSCMTDLISYTPRLPKPGETLHGHRFSIGFGGKGANQCIVSARLGAATAMVAKLGNDSFGNNYMQNFKDNGINIDHVGQTDEASTGVAPIAVDDSGQNSIIIVAGANLLLNTEDLVKAESLVQCASVVICQLEIDPGLTLAALKLAKKHGVKTIFNPAPAQAELDPEIFKFCDILCLNETETEILTKKSVGSVEEAKSCMGELLDRGCAQVIMTMGAHGSVYASKSDRTPKHIPTEKVQPIDTTGAGDAFIGALGYFLSKHGDLDLGEVIRRSGKIATISVQAPGTQTSYPWRKDLSEDIFA